MSFIKFIILIFILLFMGCTEKQSIESTTEIFGLYESNRFIEPGSLDGGVDIQSSGGYMRILLKENFEFNSELYIPENILSNYPQGRTTSDGKYTLENHTVRFHSNNFILDSIHWEPTEKVLETFVVPQRGQPFKIILNKYLK